MVNTDRKSLSECSLLIVEDDDLLSGSYGAYLSRHQPRVTVVIAPTLSIAREALNKQDFDLAIWDGQVNAPVEETLKLIHEFQHKSRMHIATSGLPGAQSLFLRPGYCHIFVPKEDIVSWLRGYFNSNPLKEKKP